MLGLCLHLFHQPRPLDRLGKAGVVLHIGGDGKLAARLQTGNQHGFEIGACSIDGSGVSGRAGTDNQYFCVIAHDDLASFVSRRGRRIWESRTGAGLLPTR